MYKEAEGNFEVIEQAIKLKWPDEVQYRSSTPEKYVEAVVKVMAGGAPKPKTRRAF